MSIQSIKVEVRPNINLPRLRWNDKIPIMELWVSDDAEGEFEGCFKVITDLYISKKDCKVLWAE